MPAFLAMACERSRERSVLSWRPCLGSETLWWRRSERFFERCEDHAQLLFGDVGVVGEQLANLVRGFFEADMPLDRHAARLRCRAHLPLCFVEHRPIPTTESPFLGMPPQAAKQFGVEQHLAIGVVAVEIHAVNGVLAVRG